LRQQKCRTLLTLGLQSYAPAGVIGRPSLATAEKGKLALEALEALVERFKPHLEALDVV
jgi:creatinine amidohydrolase